MSRSPRSTMFFGGLLGILILGLVACSEPRVPPIPRGDALADRVIREVTVIKVWDQSTDRLGDAGDPHISHYIEVDVVSGAEKGTRMTLPYDEWNVGQAPPAKGRTLLIAPADWVQRSPTSQGRPFGGW